MQNETGASPAEQLAAEVAGDASEQGTVTPDDVAEVLNLPKSSNANGDKGNSDDDSESNGDSSDDDTDDTAGEDGDTDNDNDDDAEEADEEDDNQEEAGDADEKQFVLKVTDANGKEFTIEADDDLEKVLEDFEPKSNGQIIAILDKLNALKAEKAQYAVDQEKESQQAAYQEQVKNVREGWDREITALQGEKRIPVEADGKVPKRVTEVFKFMREENDKRIAEGRPLLNSFEDALDKLELRESKDETIKKNKQEKELARQRGAKVGGSSAPASSGVSNYRRGARTATEALHQMGILH